MWESACLKELGGALTSFLAQQALTQVAQKSIQTFLYTGVRPIAAAGRRLQPLAGPPFAAAPAGAFVEPGAARDRSKCFRLLQQLLPSCLKRGHVLGWAPDLTCVAACRPGGRAGAANDADHCHESGLWQQVAGGAQAGTGSRQDAGDAAGAGGATQTSVVVTQGPKEALTASVGHPGLLQHRRACQFSSQVCLQHMLCRAVLCPGLPWWAACDAYWLQHGCAAGVPLPAGAVEAWAAGLCGECDPAWGAPKLQVCVWCAGV